MPRRDWERDSDKLMTMRQKGDDWHLINIDGEVAQVFKAAEHGGTDGAQRACAQQMRHRNDRLERLRRNRSK